MVSNHSHAGGWIIDSLRTLIKLKSNNTNNMTVSASDETQHQCHLRHSAQILAEFDRLDVDCVPHALSAIPDAIEAVQDKRRQITESVLVDVDGDGEWQAEEQREL